MSTVTAVIQLEALVEGPVFGPASPGFADATRAWNLTVDQHPAAVIFAKSADDIAAVVSFARRHGQRVAAQGTGHNAGPLGSLEGTLLVKTELMRGMHIDPHRRLARVQAGVIWGDVVAAAGQSGLAALAGSSPEVGVVGYTLGGGLSHLGRRYGLAANHVRAIEVVTADSHLIRTDPDHESDLFWALRGGGGAFGVVTAIEFDLLPLTTAYGGALWYPLERGGEVLRTWSELTQTALPDELTTVARVVRFPPAPEIPEPLRGQSFVVVAVYHIGDPAHADELLLPLRAHQPVNDTMQMIPASTLSSVFPDPEGPIAYIGDSLTLNELPPDAIDALVQVTVDDETSRLTSVEFRHLQGALARHQPSDGAASAIDAAYIMYAVGMTPTPDLEAPVRAGLDQVKDALGPWRAPQMLINLAESHEPPERLWSADTYRRLQQIKARFDPDDRIQSNHPISPYAR
ncbi:MAG TPA: FAD-dependent oxidoreductase [Acidimicrobiales bacterium]|nr:FAD-dependent oxidoreductase [Acidimicrobiales bacterium]